MTACSHPGCTNTGVIIHRHELALDHVNPWCIRHCPSCAEERDMTEVDEAWEIELARLEKKARHRFHWGHAMTSNPHHRHPEDPQ